MLQQESPEDFVLATGETHSVRQFLQLAFNEIGKELVWEGEGSDEIGKDKETGNVLIKVRTVVIGKVEGDANASNESQPSCGHKSLIAGRRPTNQPTDRPMQRTGRGVTSLRKFIHR